MWTAFDYMYRDAGNFKAFGSVIIEGRLRPSEEALVRSRLSSGEFFIAEQVGVPPLYHDLYLWSGGATESDHCWHEFVGFCEIAEPESASDIIKANEFVSHFTSAKTWDETLSPHGRPTVQ